MAGTVLFLVGLSAAVFAQEVPPSPSTRFFSANECLDLGSLVSLDYFDQAPFAFNGTLGTTRIKYVN
jgi:hypothetical protein